jgi:hypothetical protein
VTLPDPANKITEIVFYETNPLSGVSLSKLWRNKKISGDTVNEFCKMKCSNKTGEGQPLPQYRRVSHGFFAF